MILQYLVDHIDPLLTHVLIHSRAGRLNLSENPPFNAPSSATFKAVCSTFGHPNRPATVTGCHPCE